MAHPFSKIFEKALRTSSADENLVLEAAEKIKAKGYSAHEICTVLQKLRMGLIDDAEADIVAEAIDECCEEIEL